MNEHGDQRGQDDAYAARFRETLARMQAPKLAPAEALRKGSATIDALRAFLVRTRQRGVLVVGGLPTTFDEVRIEPDYLAALRHLYEASGQRFLVLDNRSQYPRSAFSDSEYHLKQSQARVHSRLIADALRPLLR